MDNVPTSPAKVPWNKGKIVGQKAPLKLKDIWPSGSVFNLDIERENLHYLTWAWTANSGPVISCGLVSGTFATAIVFQLVQSSCSRRLPSRSSSK